MRILFFGLNEFGEECLQELLKHKYTITSVVIAPEQRSSKIYALCKSHSIPLIRYDQHTIYKQVLVYNPDVIIVASFSKLLPVTVIKYPPLGVLNLHPSLLPRYRGAHPIQWAIIRDEPYLGVTLHYLDEGIDSGDIVAQKKILLTEHDTLNSMKKKLIKVGCLMLINVLKKIRSDNIKLSGIPQSQSSATFAPKRKPEDGRISFAAKTRDIFNIIRALQKPAYYAFSYNKQGDKIEFIKSYRTRQQGKVLAKIKQYYLISTYDGVILIQTNKTLNIGEVIK